MAEWATLRATFPGSRKIFSGCKYLILEWWIDAPKKLLCALVILFRLGVIRGLFYSVHSSPWVKTIMYVCLCLKNCQKPKWHNPEGKCAVPGSKIFYWPLVWYVSSFWRYLKGWMTPLCDMYILFIVLEELKSSLICCFPSPF